jgi:hypothetical protein
MWCPVRVHNGGNRAKSSQTGKAPHPTTAGHRGVLCIKSAEFGADTTCRDYLKKFAPVATHLLSPTSGTKSATSGLMHCSNFASRGRRGPAWPRASAFALFRRISIDKNFKIDAAQQLHTVVCFNFSLFHLWHTVVNSSSRSRDQIEQIL